jgi:glycerol-3-phosphate dehydrogenase
VRESDIESFLAVINRYLPSAKLRRADVLFAYAGLRPLVADGSKGTYGVSRRAELVDHAGEGVDGLFSALGGKWTTSRRLAQQVTDALVRKLGVKAPACATADVALPGGRFDDFDGMVKGFQKTYPGIATLRPMAHMLGARLPLALKGAKLTDLAKLSGSGDTMAQILLALREEMVVTLDDMVMRRTAIGQFGRPDAGVIDRIAATMAAQLGWDADKTAREIESLERNWRVAA